MIYLGLAVFFVTSYVVLIAALICAKLTFEN